MNALISTLLPLAYLDPGTGRHVLQGGLAPRATAAAQAPLCRPQAPSPPPRGAEDGARSHGARSAAT